MLAHKSWLISVSVALCISLTLLLELTQTRVLSFVFWNHAVYLTVSIALLGFGISGTLVSLFGVCDSRTLPRLMQTLWAGFGISTFADIGLTAWVLPIVPGSHWASLPVCYVVYVIPFLFGGAILAPLFGPGEHWSIVLD